MNMKLTNIQSVIVNLDPARPTPLLETSLRTTSPLINWVPCPFQYSQKSSSPTTLYCFSTASGLAFCTRAASMAPFTGPSTSPYGYLPPCNPADTTIVPAPAAGVMQELWCVAKPSVPEDTLQEALDYAYGDGGADCSEIMSHGNCFYPDTVVVHASYAFNSYYQKNKRNGGSCSFGGTAMLIASDPSFLHCRFLMS